MTSSRKKVIIRSLEGVPTMGWLSPRAFVHRFSPAADAPGEPASPFLDLIHLDGHTLSLPLALIKLISFVRDFNRDDPTNPERVTRRAFLSRPRAEGLWLRLTFTTGDQLEGLAAQDLTFLDDLLDDAGIFLTPPDDRANTHRIYVPRTAIATLEVLAVINAPIRKTQTSRKPAADQPTLFPS